MALQAHSPRRYPLPRELWLCTQAIACGVTSRLLQRLARCVTRWAYHVAGRSIAAYDELVGLCK